MKAQRASGGAALNFFNLGARWGIGWLAHPRQLYSLGKRPGTHFTGSWMGQRVGMREILPPSGFEI